MDTNNIGQFNGWFSEMQVRDLLVAVQVFSNANGNQGLSSVAGENYGERAEVMMKAFCGSSSHQQTVSKFKTPLDEYEFQVSAV